MRSIIHADINYCYAQIEELKNPELKNVPMVVGGDESLRQGIVLAKNPLASAYGIKTADTLYVARRKCPQLVVVAPNYIDYMEVTEAVKDIYRSYTDQVESFGLDEAWLDVTNSYRLFGDVITIAKEVQNRVLLEIGLTVSVGVSWNKIFAKLGSDMKKPMGFTVIDKSNYQSLVWPLAADNLLGVGHKTYPKLLKMNIVSIGDLAQADGKKLHRRLGKQGLMLKQFAMGLDDSSVKRLQDLPKAKSVGNSITLVRDIYTMREAKLVLRRLSESVASRMRLSKVVGQVVSIQIRDKNLRTVSKQIKLPQHSDGASDFYEWAILLLESYEVVFELGVRSLGLSVSELIDKKESAEQISLFDQKTELDYLIDDLQIRFGDNVIQRGSMLLDKSLTGFNPKKEHKVHPVSYQ